MSLVRVSVWSKEAGHIPEPQCGCGKTMPFAYNDGLGQFPVRRCQFPDTQLLFPTGIFKHNRCTDVAMGGRQVDMELVHSSLLEAFVMEREPEVVPSGIRDLEPTGGLLEVGEVLELGFWEKALPQFRKGRGK